MLTAVTVAFRDARIVTAAGNPVTLRMRSAILPDAAAGEARKAARLYGAHFKKKRPFTVEEATSAREDSQISAYWGAAPGLGNAGRDAAEVSLRSRHQA